jgi:hypothetical protein
MTCEEKAELIPEVVFDKIGNQYIAYHTHVKNKYWGAGETPIQAIHDFRDKVKEMSD